MELFKKTESLRKSTKKPQKKEHFSLKNIQNKVEEYFLDFEVNDLKRINPSKTALNIVVGIDTIYKQIRFMRIFGVEFKDAVFQDYPYTNAILSDEFNEEFKNIFVEYFKTLPASHSLACYLVLPDNLVGMDNIALPSMQKAKLFSSLNTHLAKEYKQFRELRFNRYIAGKNRQYVVFYLTSIRKSYLASLYKSMAVNKLFVKSCSYSGNCAVNSVLQFDPSYRRKSFILFDVKADYTHVSVCINGKTAGVTNFKLGTMHLPDDKVLQENMLYDHDVADLAIINAKEKARMKMLTVTGDDEEDTSLENVADIVEAQLHEGINLNAKDMQEHTADEQDGDFSQERDDIASESKQIDSATFSQVLKENVAPDVNPIDAVTDNIILQDPEEALVGTETVIQDELVAAKKKKIFARKMPKRLPKFMLRETPETPEGFIYENFRMFIKWALLYNSQLKQKEYLPKIDTVLINIDEKYQSAIDKANTEEEASELKFVRLENLGPNINAHLDLVGALYGGVFNKRQNF